MVRPANLENETFTGLRGKIAAFVENSRFINTIAALIILNAITLGMETDAWVRDNMGDFLYIVDTTILCVFVVEIALKLFVYRLSFFRAGWNVFDFIIVTVALLPASGALSILRAMRIFRVLRLLSIVPQMRRVISALLLSLPGMTSIVAILFIIFYVSAVLATKIFGSHPDPMMQELFGSIWGSMYTLFTVMTLEGWSENIALPTMEHFPYAWLYFLPFIIVTSFAVLNLFIGIIVDAMNIVQGKDLKSEGDEIVDATLAQTKILTAEIETLRSEIKEMRKELKSK